MINPLTRCDLVQTRRGTSACLHKIWFGELA